MEMQMAQPPPSLLRKIDRKRGFAFGLVMFLIMLIASTISGRLFYSLRVTARTLQKVLVMQKKLDRFLKPFFQKARRPRELARINT
jgi:hypothetical protein